MIIFLNLVIYEIIYQLPIKNKNLHNAVTKIKMSKNLS